MAAGLLGILLCLSYRIHIVWGVGSAMLQLGIGGLLITAHKYCGLHAHFLTEVYRSAGKVYKSVAEAEVGVRQWAKFLALMGTVGETATPRDVAASLRALKVDPRAAGCEMDQRTAVKRAAACIKHVDKVTLYRGVCLGFPGGREIYDSWANVEDGELVGFASLSSTSLYQGTALDDYPEEMEWLLAVLSIYAVYGRPEVRNIATGLRGIFSPRYALVVTLDFVESALPPEFVVRVRDDAMTAQQRLSELDRLAEAAAKRKQRRERWSVSLSKERGMMGEKEREIMEEWEQEMGEEGDAMEEAG
eukprot:gene52408-24389_t